MKIYVIDNGGQWTHKEWRVLRDLDIRVEIKSNTSRLDEISDADGLVLSGGAPSIAYESFRLGNTSEYLEKMKIPILGICAGAQYMAVFYGGTVSPARHPEFGKVKITVEYPNNILRGVSKEFFVWENHNDEIKIIPEGFSVLASSATCPVQAISNESISRYALQFHPEVEHTQFGEKIFSNFIEVCGS